MEGGPRRLDLGPWSPIRPTIAVCSLADWRGAGPIMQHRHGIPRYLQISPGGVVRLVALQEPVGPVCRVPIGHAAQPVAPVDQARYVEVLADRVRPVGVASSPRENHRHPEVIRISALATPVVLELGRAIICVVEETESYLTLLFYHRRLHDVGARVELEQLLVLQVLHVPVVVPVARVEQGGGGPRRPISGTSRTGAMRPKFGNHGGVSTLLKFFMSRLFIAVSCP